MGTFLDELVVGDVFFHPTVPTVACGRVSNADVTGLALHVLRPPAATHSLIEPWAAIARVDDDGAACKNTKRLKHSFAKVLDVRNYHRVVDAVVNAQARCSLRTHEFWIVYEKGTSSC